MISDGYDMQSFLRLEKFKVCSDAQLKTNDRLKEIAKEISELPKMPNSIEEWIDSWSGLDNKGFGMNAFLKHSRIKKEYSKLIENSDRNLREMKILAIEDLIEKINITLNK